MTGCSSGLTVRSDEDPGAEFGRYQTWNFFDPMGIEGGYNSPVFGELFREAITREMTERGYRLTENPDLLRHYETQTPLRRIGEPEDIGGIAVLLASRAGAFITGQTIVADGGVTIAG